MTSWRLIDSGPCDAAFNMAIDEALSISVRQSASSPVLRIYGWSSPSVSLGAFQKTDDIDYDCCSRLAIAVVRRPTGGRAILHGDELTYSFSSRNDGIFSAGLTDTYRKIAGAFRLCFDRIGLLCTIKEERESGRNLTKSPLCFASTSIGEISSRGIKLAGSAQKRWKDGFLQQGSVPFSIDHQMLSEVFRLPLHDRSRISACDSTWKNKGLRVTDRGFLMGLQDFLPAFDAMSFKRHLISAFEETFSVSLVGSPPFPQELELAHLLSAGKYRDPIWTWGEKAGSLSGNKTERPMQ